MKLLLNPEYGLYEKGGQVFCDSLQVAKGLKKRHDHVLRDIESKLDDISKSNLPKFGEINFNYDYYRDEKNRKQPRYLLTKDGFVFLISSYGGVEATNFKIAYITRFNEMEAFIKSLQTAKLEFPAFTNAIMEAHEEPNIGKFSMAAFILCFVGASMRDRAFAAGFESIVFICRFLFALAIVVIFQFGQEHNSEILD